MAFRRVSTMTWNLTLLFCLVAAVLNDLVTPTTARELTSASAPNEKQVSGTTGGRGGENGGAGDNQQAVAAAEYHPSNKNSMTTNSKARMGPAPYDQKQIFPFPFPWVPPFGLPMPTPFPYPPFGVPGMVPPLPVPSYPYPPPDGIPDDIPFVPPHV